MRDPYENEKLNMEYSAYDGFPKVIETVYNEVIGYIWYNNEDDNTLHVKMIEVIQKECGYGTKIVHWLFKELDLNRMTGYILNERSMRPYWFWYSLGSEMSVDPDEAEHYYGNDIYFILNRESILS